MPFPSDSPFSLRVITTDSRCRPSPNVRWMKLRPLSRHSCARMNANSDGTRSCTMVVNSLSRPGSWLVFTSTANHRLMDHRAMEMVVESQPQSRANGIMVADDSEADRQRGRYCHQKELLGLRLRRLPDTIANSSFQIRRRRYFAHRIP